MPLRSERRSPTAEFVRSSRSRSHDGENGCSYRPGDVVPRPHQFLQFWREFRRHGVARVVLLLSSSAVRERAAGVAFRPTFAHRRRRKPRPVSNLRLFASDFGLNLAVLGKPRIGGGGGNRTRVRGHENRAMARGCRRPGSARLDFLPHRGNLCGQEAPVPHLSPTNPDERRAAPDSPSDRRQCARNMSASR